MTDKIQKIKEEIERQIDYAEDDTRYTESYREGLITAYQTIKAFIDSLPEEHNEDLEEAANKYAENHGFRVPYDGSNKFYDDVDVKASKEGFIAGAEWQRKKDQETIELAEDHAMLAGMNRMKEELMKDALDGWVSLIVKSDTSSRNLFISTPQLYKELQKYEEGDKVKIIIVKTEQQ